VCQCGAAMHYIGKGRPPKNRPYLTCADARRGHGDCTAPSVRYEPVEAFVVRGIVEVDLSAIFPARINAAKERMIELEKALLELNDEQKINKKRLDNAVLELLDNPSDAIREAQRHLEERQSVIDKRLHELEQDRGGLHQTLKGIEQDKQERNELLQRWEGLQEVSDDNVLHNLRAKLNQSLRNTIHSITFHPDYGDDTGDHIGTSLWVSLNDEDKTFIWRIEMWKEGRVNFFAKAQRVFGPLGNDEEVIQMEWH
jgi:hypothetical protein